MATNVLLPLSSSSVGRSGVAVSGQSGLRGRQRTKEHSPASLAGFTGSVTRRGKGEEMNRAPLKTKPSRRTITQEIDPSRYPDLPYLIVNNNSKKHLAMFQGLFSVSRIRPLPSAS